MSASLLRIGMDARLVYYQAAGIGQYILCLLEAMAREVANTTFIALKSYKDTHDLSKFSGRSVVRQKSMLTPPHHRFEQLLLPLELLPLRLALLHSPDHIPPVLYPGRVVVTVHDLAFMRYPETLTAESRGYYGQLRTGLRRADAIIAVSEHTRSDLLELAGADPVKITVIPEAAHPTFRKLEDTREDRMLLRSVRDRYGLPESFLLFVSTIEPRKNLSGLFKAYRLLLDRAGNAQPPLVIAGSKGWLYEDTLRLIEDLRLAGHILLLGRVSHESLIALYNSATAFIYPSLYEGFGLPVLEAMACGAPVIASQAASIPQVAGDAALLVDPLDTEALAMALARILSDAELRAGLRQRGFIRAASFTWQRAAQETLALYTRVLR